MVGRRREEGFTLIELMVVVLIIAVLLAIALPAYVKQQKMAKDADAKTEVRNLVNVVETCYLETSDYRLCDEQSELDTTGITWGSFDRQVYMWTSANATSYRIISHSERARDGWFDIRRTNGGRPVRNCSLAGEGGCRSSLDANGNRW